MKKLIVAARTDQLERVLDFLTEELAAAGCPLKTQTQVMVAAEEIFVNIAKYAYVGAGGGVAIVLDISGDPPLLKLEFRDSGQPYNPLSREDPDVSLSAEDREIGGLGVYMVKKTMDSVAYAYRDGENILTVSKRF